MSGNQVNNVASDLLHLLNQSTEGTSNIANDLLTLINDSTTTVQSDSNQNSAIYFLSSIEQSILRAANPIEINESEELTVLGQRGIWLNRAEVNAWRGDISISEYRINEDQNPQVITKRVEHVLEYVQELAIRYLRPPTPPAPGEIVITQEADYKTGPAPPLIIRQQPLRPDTPEPLVVREAPPQPPAPVGPKRITISGKRLPPPPRKVVIERLAALPSKPQNVIIERWLPYAEQKRRVIFNRAQEVKAEVATPRNVIVQWAAPAVNIKKEIKYLGVIRANPAEYVQRYGATLKVHTSLPQFVLDIPTPSEFGVLAANYRHKSVYELEGALEGFNYIDLDAEGLSEYRSQLISLGIRDLGAGSSSQFASTAAYSTSSPASASGASASIASAAEQIFNMIDTDRSGSITIEEAESVVLKLNSRLSRAYGEVEVKAFFAAASGYSDLISKEQFVKVFVSMTKDE